MLTDAGGRPEQARAPGPSAPVELQIPAIELRTAVVPIGLRPDRTLDLPAPGEDAPAAWYRGSPTPGENGSSVIAGRVDSAEHGPAVFHRLRLLRPGDEIQVRRADGSEVRFVVIGVGLHPKKAFPNERVFGPRDYPVLTLVTSGGAHPANVVVFARVA
ncbi:sortase domain-bontaining protein [Actinoplanes sp. NPDC051513]|uniref:sortase domain-containing protein n=1 Tax=Actinoplanes sp. NPDC051513 TaxID=3363908 RepID=UPI0037B39607